jgi:phosphinothricin acetyltransferase
MTFTARPATSHDAEDIARIYSAGIQDRVGTFETRERTPAEIRTWFDGRHPIVVVENGAGRVIAFACTSTYRDRECYSGIAEFSVYVDREARGRGAGRTAMAAMIDGARDAGYWKLVSRVFVENMASRTLLSKVGFREVGIYRRHARLDGAWRDVVIVERLIPENQPDEPSR